MISDFLVIEEIELDLDCDGHHFALATFSAEIQYFTDCTWSIAEWRFKDGKPLIPGWPNSMQDVLIKQLNAYARTDIDFRARVTCAVMEAVPHVDENAEHKLRQSELI